MLDLMHTLDHSQRMHERHEEDEDRAILHALTAM
jgi:hypothetical protein